MNIPFVQSYEKIIRSDIMANEGYMELFEFILEMVSMLSEANRGGERSVCRGITIDGRSMSGVFIYKSFDWKITANSSFLYTG